ncbi:MAG: recombinase family protein [Dysosmobacter sp.]|nr:recombinase family protein [Dysosmobacter sp.]
MPRKSRKEAIRAINAGQIPEIPAQRPESQPMEQIYQTVGYARLSVAETRDRKDGEALQNQKALLREYIQKKANLRLVDICEDNGQTGTNFQRAGFERMMELIRSGKANCIVVKDLSRFGRDHVEAGNFLENVFPYIGVRFISIGDGYDSADATTTDCLMVALRNLGNQIYSMDISRKSGSVLREKIRRGEFIGAYAAYGYIKDPDDRHHIVIDPEAAEVVREIFRRKLEGASNVAIVRRLNEAAIPSPCCYRHQKGILVDKRFEQPKPWTATTVKKILTCQTYIGDMVQGRRRSEFYAGKADRMLPREDWCVVEGTHEPIVSRKDFEAVQDILETARSRYQSRLGVYDHLGKSENILKGLVFCGDCGKPMVRYKQVSHGKSVTYHYLCPNYAALLDRSGCSYKFLREDVLMDALTEMISAEIRQTVDAAKLAQRLSMANRVQAENLSLELKRLNSELARAETAKKGAMEDYLSGLLSQEDYERLKRACAGETMRLKGRISALQTDYTKQTETLTQGNPWLQTFGGIDLEDGLTGPLAHSLIQRVTVYENDRIDVTLRYRDEKAQLLTAGDAGEVVA